MEKPNPNSHERPKAWSELSLDLLISVFERLGFADFHRGKSVCSSWYSASRQSTPKNQSPWLIVFPEDDNNYCTLFNPDEKHKVYKTKYFGLGFAKSECKSTCGSWLLMQDHPFIFYIVNLFTQERFNLPFSKWQVGPRKMEHIIRSLVFWIDEKTKDYVIIWDLNSRCVVYFKKGDTSWKRIPKTRGCCDMVYKDHKLYFLSYSGNFKISDFSGEFPQETFQCHVLSPQYEGQNKLVVTAMGDVLMVVKMHNCVPKYDEWSPFRIYKICSSGILEKIEQVDSLGDEAMFFYLGITLLANHIKGFNKNSIYLDGRLFFNLETQEMEPLCKFDRSSSIQLSKARWFLPSFMQP